MDRTVSCCALILGLFGSACALETKGEGESIATATAALKGVVDQDDVLDFEDVAGWHSTIELTLSSQKTSGDSSLAVQARGYTVITSQEIGEVSVDAKTVQFALFLPTAQPNPYWFGHASLFVSIPSKSVNNRPVGVQMLDQYALGQWNVVEFAVPADLAAVINAGGYADLSFSIVLNVPQNATGTYLLDHLNFGSQWVTSADSVEMNELLTKTTEPYVVTKSFKLAAGVTVYRPLQFVGDGADNVTFDCNGGRIGCDEDNPSCDTRGKDMISVRTEFPEQELMEWNDATKSWDLSERTDCVLSKTMLALASQTLDQGKGYAEFAAKVAAWQTDKRDHGVPEDEIETLPGIICRHTLKKRNGGFYKRNRPEHVTIKNCHIRGRTRVWGLGGTGQNDLVRQSAFDAAAPGHVRRARDAAPRDIVFDNVTVGKLDRSAFYVAPGVTHFQLLNSIVEGTGTILYLDAESAKNTIRHNVFRVRSGRRELISIDGSSENWIDSNVFTRLDHGGIHLYRNCGEDGSIRFTPPRDNQIINNHFLYDNDEQAKSAIYLGSRNLSPNDSFCAEDAFFSALGGSASSDLDYAQYNVVMQNHFFNSTPSEYIKTKNKVVNSPNYIGANDKVTKVETQPSGCYLASGFAQNFIQDFTAADVIKTRDGHDWYVRQACTNGVLEPLTEHTIAGVAFGYTMYRSESGRGLSLSGAAKSSDGKTVTASCPEGKSVIGAKALCNLNGLVVSGVELAALSAGVLDIATVAEPSTAGECVVGDTTIVDRKDVIRGGAGAHSVALSCKGTDGCVISGYLYCQ